MSKYGAGDLNERITFSIPELVHDGRRGKNVYADGDSVWAHVRWVSDGERFRANSLQQTIDVRFIVRTRSIGRDWRVTHKGIVYNIVGIKPIDTAFVEVTCGATPNVI